ncbi:MAG: DUF2946 domain-containing protein [Burkholderiaceae bacterium]
MFSIILQRIRKKARTLGVLFVLIFAMMLRGVVPAGYMPGPQGGSHGNALFAFCAPDNGTAIPNALTALWADVDTGTDSSQAMMESCAFCVLGQLVMGLPQTGDLAVMPAAFFSRPLAVLRNIALPVHGPRGPPLGSRAPPFFIV